MAEKGNLVQATNTLLVLERSWKEVGNPNPCVSIVSKSAALLHTQGMRDRRRQGNASAAAEESGAGALAGNTPTGGLQEMTAGQRCCWGVNVELGLIDFLTLLAKVAIKCRVPDICVPKPKLPSSFWHLRAAETTAIPNPL